MLYLKERKICPLILASLFILAIPVLSYCADPKNTDTAKTGVTPIVSEGARQSERGRDIFDLSVELMTSVHGEQTFDVIDSDETLISRLKFPHRGQTMVFNGELYVLPRLSLGGRFCSSRVLQLSNANSTDTDWKANTFNRVWTESYDDTKTEINFFDANIYARLLNLEKGSGTGIAGKASDFLLIGQDGRLSFDLFGGYQFQEGRYEMCNMTQTVENYIPVSEKINSHDSFYKITYRGPRLGARSEYSFSRFSARLSFAYAWLKTKASAYWNLRDYPFYQHGDGYDGYGVDLNAEFKYQFTKHISGGFGYNYMIRRQHKMKESGDDRSGTGNYTDSDNIRNANSTLYGPSVFVKVNW
ncbi:MAG: hypothetical protein PHQ57_02975 [Candidatus Omnitrophica bacterium]|nr:hypothetical protein [Candidatus Omnitrophota bacterium]